VQTIVHREKRVGHVKLATDSQPVELEHLPAPNVLTGVQIGQFLDALLAAYSREELTRMVRIRLDANLDAIAGSGDLSTVCFNLIGWAISQGEVARLIAAVQEDKPKNPQIRAFVHALGHELDSV
jgi:hypothetical protein